MSMVDIRSHKHILVNWWAFELDIVPDLSSLMKNYGGQRVQYTYK